MVTTKEEEEEHVMHPKEVENLVQMMPHFFEKSSLSSELSHVIHLTTQESLAHGDHLLLHPRGRYPSPLETRLGPP